MTEEESAIHWQRVDTTGPESIERLRAIRSQEGAHFANTRQEFGQEQLKSWEFLQLMSQISRVRSEIAEDGNTTEPTRVTKSREVFERSWDRLSKQLQWIAKARPELSREFFGTLQRVPDFAALEPVLSANSLYDPADSEMQELIQEQARAMRAAGDQRPEAELLVAAKQQRVGAELADILTMAYAEDETTAPEIVMAIVAWRGKELEKQFTETQAKIEAMVPQLRQKLESAIDDGKIPISKELLAERMDSLVYDIVDPLTAKLEALGGEYIGDKHRVLVRADMADEQLEGVVLHEVLHSLSGKTEFQIQDDTPELVYIEQTRVGLNLKAKALRNETVDLKEHAPNLRWLNEAVTEDLTIDIAGKGETRVYQMERLLLARLTRDGALPKSVVARAYFENTTAQPQPGEHAAPALRELFTQSNRIFGQGFLTNLDRFIVASARGVPSRGAAAAVAKWNELDQNFPAYLAAWRSRESKRTA